MTDADWQKEMKAAADRLDRKRLDTLEDLIDRASDLWLEFIACGKPEIADKIGEALDALGEARGAM